MLSKMIPFRLHISLCQPVSSKIRCNPGKQFLHPVGFGHIIIRSTFQPLYNIHFFSYCCQENDRCLTSFLPDLPAKVISVTIREHHI